MARTPLPWMQWFPADHLGDRHLRACERGTRADWVDLCSVMWERRVGHLIGTPAQLARMIGVGPDEMANTIADLAVNGAANVDPMPALGANGVSCTVDMTVGYRVTSRRLTRVLHERGQAAERQKRFRDTHGNGVENATRNTHSNEQGRLPLMNDDRDADSNTDSDAESNGVSDASASDQRLLEDQRSESVLSAGARALWTPTAFRTAWERVTTKSGMVAPELLTAATDKCAESARMGKVADVVAHGEALIAALPQVVAWYRRSGMSAPTLSIPTFLDEKHFSRCEDVVRGELDVTEPMARATGGKRADDPQRGTLAVARIATPEAEQGAIVERRR